ncbi:tetratricopeptide repeat protein [Hwanghaeella sp.]|uniref:tetratricopeptide repeat protein n=1 Tax=Hwanghaeella sp. TaxID=2605943 RepID=UPI003CCBA3AB
MKAFFTMAVFGFLSMVAVCDAAPPPFPQQENATENPLEIGESYFLAQEYRKALQPLLIAAGDGLGRASFLLGEMYEFALGVEQDQITASVFYMFGAHQGFGDAQFRIANRIERGVFAPYDRVASLKWYLLAAQNPTTTHSLKRSAQSAITIFVQRDCAECAEQLRQAEILAKDWKPVYDFDRIVEELSKPPADVR